MAEVELDENGDYVPQDPVVDDGSHHFWHHHSPLDALRCGIIELRLWSRDIHPRQQH